MKTLQYNSIFCSAEVIHRSFLANSLLHGNIEPDTHTHTHTHTHTTTVYNPAAHALRVN